MNLGILQIGIQSFIVQTMMVGMFHLAMGDIRSGVCLKKIWRSLMPVTAGRLQW